MPIGFFQFENLIRSRVPFVLFVWDFDFAGWYSGMEKIHLEQVLRPVDQIVNLLPDLQRNLDQPIVFVCETGKDSKGQVEKFEKLGFKNVFYVLDGWAGMKKERQP